MDPIMRITKLGENNYSTWRQEIEWLLKEKKLYGSVTGKLTPEEKKEDVDSTCVAVIGRCMLPHLYFLTQGSKTGKELLQTIDNLFANVGKARVLDLQEQFYTLTMRDRESIIEFASRATRLRDSLTDAGQQPSDTHVKMRILNGLPLTYGSTKETIADWAMDDDVRLPDLIARLQLTEHRLAKERSADPVLRRRATALTANAQDHCTYCKKIGHVREDCRKKKRDDAKRAERAAITCDYCGRNGHTKDQCYKRASSINVNGIRKVSL